MRTNTLNAAPEWLQEVMIYVGAKRWKIEDNFYLVKSLSPWGGHSWEIVGKVGHYEN